jgi:hypothetical protein
VRCRITVSGVLGEADSAAFADFDIETSGTYSVLIGELDQLKLSGVQNHLRPMGLRVVGLAKVETPPSAA